MPSGSMPGGSDRGRVGGGWPVVARAVYDAAEVIGGLAICRLAGLGVVLHEDCRAVALALSDHADVEANVEQLGRGELAQRQDRAVEGVTEPVRHRLLATLC